MLRTKPQILETEIGQFLPALAKKCGVELAE
jgi:hypothetical protein